jgi:hypothetical protein
MFDLEGRAERVEIVLTGRGTLAQAEDPFAYLPDLHERQGCH